jgi:hypothetical protein
MYVAIYDNVDAQAAMSSNTAGHPPAAVCSCYSSSRSSDRPITYNFVRNSATSSGRLSKPASLQDGHHISNCEHGYGLLGIATHWSKLQETINLMF